MSSNTANISNVQTQLSDTSNRSNKHTKPAHIPSDPPLALHSSTTRLTFLPDSASFVSMKINASGGQSAQNWENCERCLYTPFELPCTKTAFSHSFSKSFGSDTQNPIYLLTLSVNNANNEILYNNCAYLGAGAFGLGKWKWWLPREW